MKTFSRHLKALSRVCLSLAGLIFASGVGHAAPEQAKSADSFVDSLGVNTHWSYPDTPYGASYDKVRKALAGSGIRHIRGEVSRAACHSSFLTFGPAKKVC